MAFRTLVLRVARRVVAAAAAAAAAVAAVAAVAAAAAAARGCGAGRARGARARAAAIRGLLDRRGRETAGRGLVLLGLDIHLRLDVDRHGVTIRKTLRVDVAAHKVREGRVSRLVLGVGRRRVEAGRQRDNVVVCLLDRGVLANKLAHRAVRQLVREHNDTVVVRGAVVALLDNVLVVLVDLLRRLAAAGLHVPVIRVIVPDDRAETQEGGNRTHTVVHVTKRRAPAARRHTRHVLDNAHGVVQLREHLRVGQRRHVVVRPGVHANVVAVGQAALRLQRPVDHVRANVEQRGLEIVLLHVVVEGIVRAVRAIVKGQAPGARLGARRNVLLDLVALGRGAAGRSPPAVGVLVHVVRVGRLVADAHVVLHALLGLDVGDDVGGEQLLKQAAAVVVANDNVGNLTSLGVCFGELGAVRETIRLALLRRVLDLSHLGIRRRVGPRHHTGAAAMRMTRTRLQERVGLGHRETTADVRRHRECRGKHNSATHNHRGQLHGESRSSW